MLANQLFVGVIWLDYELGWYESEPIFPVFDKYETKINNIAIRE